MNYLALICLTLALGFGLTAWLYAHELEILEWLAWRLVYLADWLLAQSERLLRRRRRLMEKPEQEQTEETEI